MEPGASATNDRRPEFQRMVEAATAKPPAFDIVVVHSFSRFFRDHFELEFYVRKLAKNGVKLALEGDGTSGPMGVKAIVKHLNARRIFTRDGGRWGVGQLHRLLTQPTYIGRHEFKEPLKKSFTMRFRYDSLALTERIALDAAQFRRV